MNAIQLSNLTKYYGKSRGILNLNLDVKEGEFFGFIGPNGAGKSTTIRTLLGLITPSSGQARFLMRQSGSAIPKFVPTSATCRLRRYSTVE